MMPSLSRRRFLQISAGAVGVAAAGTEASLGAPAPMPKVELPAHVVKTVKSKERKEGC